LTDSRDRRLERRAVRRRRVRHRRIAALFLLPLAVLGVVLALTLSGSPGPRKVSPKSAAAPAPPPQTTRRKPRHSTQATTLQRLIRIGLPVYCGGRRGRDVALTFDDGPGVYTPLALRILARAHVRATFFLVGKSIERFPTLPRLEARLAALGDHTWTHRLLPALPASVIRNEIVRTKTLISRVTGKPVSLFRPPYAARSPTVDQQVRSAGLLDILWDVDSHDWIRGTGWTQIGNTVIAGLKPGAIISMHENHGQTIRALRYLILPAITRLHLHAVTIPQLLQHDPPTLHQLRAGYAGCTQHHPLGHGA
jgi:peptidoglycan-N-acetylglucosamine deacetylase